MATTAQEQDRADSGPPAPVSHRDILAYEFFKTLIPDLDAKVKKMPVERPPEILDGLCKKSADAAVKNAQKRRLAASIDDEIDQLAREYVGRELRLSC